MEDRGTAEQDLPAGLLALAERHREKLHIHFTPNIGPQRKLLPMLKRLQDNNIENAVIVTADDAVIVTQMTTCSTRSGGSPQCCAHTSTQKAWLC